MPNEDVVVVVAASVQVMEATAVGSHGRLKGYGYIPHPFLVQAGFRAPDALLLSLHVAPRLSGTLHT